MQKLIISEVKILVKLIIFNTNLFMQAEVGHSFKPTHTIISVVYMFVCMYI